MVESDIAHEPVAADTPAVSRPVKPRFTFSSLKEKKYAKFAILILLIAAVALTVFIAQTRQTLKQHASECGITCPVNGLIPPRKDDPADGAFITTRAPYFSWDNLGAHVSYVITIREDSSAGPIRVEGKTVANSVQIASSSGLLTGKTYYWNVRSCVSATCSSFGPWVRFSIVAGTIPAIIKPYLPADGTILDTVTPRLSWNIPQGATADTIYTIALVDLSSTSGSLLPITYKPGYVSVYGSVLIPASEGLQLKHKYAWNVKACNGVLCSYPNNSWVFTLAAPAAPARPIGLPVKK